MSNYIPYWIKLKNPKWQRKRLEIMQRDGFACTRCGEKEKTLNVHHGFYYKGVEPWEYSDDTLWTLCEDCHSKVQDALHDANLEVGRCSPEQITNWLAPFIADSRRKWECEDPPPNFGDIQGMFASKLTLEEQKKAVIWLEYILYSDKRDEFMALLKNTYEEYEVKQKAFVDEFYKNNPNIKRIQ